MIFDNPADDGETEPEAAALHYQGQSYELPVAMPEGEIDQKMVEKMIEQRRATGGDPVDDALVALVRATWSACRQFGARVSSLPRSGL